MVRLGEAGVNGVFCDPGAFRLAIAKDSNPELFADLKEMDDNQKHAEDMRELRELGVSV